MKTVTLPEMLGPDLFAWLEKQLESKTLTLPLLRAKLEADSAFLAERGIDAGYAYYAVQHVLSRSGALDQGE